MNNQFKQKLDSFTKALVTELPQINEAVAMNAYALVKDRVLNDGELGNGNSLGKYSEKELPLFFFKPNDKAREIANKLGRKNITGERSRKKKTEYKATSLSYKAWRDGNNLQTDHVSLSFTGQMMKDIGVVKNVVDGNKIVTTVGAKNTKDRDGKSTEDILGYNADRYGDLLTVNTTEEKQLANTYDVKLQELINKHF